MSIEFSHRAVTGAVGLLVGALAAAGTLVAITALLIRARRHRERRPDLFGGSLAAYGLLVFQVISAIVFSRMGLASSLTHAALMALLVACTSYRFLAVTLEGRARPEVVQGSPGGRTMKRAEPESVAL